ncbi:MAG: GNAT family N-acetyltransferase [Patescibacteria group bacterium]
MEIKLRRVNLNDLEFVFNLRNEEAVRLVSFSSDLIDLETHRKWFEKKLASNESVLLIAEIDSQPVAQVRFDWLYDHGAEINIAVTEKFRGRGCGTEIIRKSSILFLNEFPVCGDIYAYIKPDNIASIRSFTKAGFISFGETEHKGQKCIAMNLTR